LTRSQPTRHGKPLGRLGAGETLDGLIPAAADVVDSLVDALPAQVQPITRSIARAAAQLRATHGTRLRLPDALVVATALDLGADHVLPTDRRWPKVGVTIQAI
jgi:predicted nucleic acid-binding protein